MPSLSRLLILRSLLRQRPRNSNNSYGQNNVNTNSSSPSPSPPHHSPANPNPNNPRPKTSSDGPPGKQPPPPPPPPPPSWLGHPFRVLANTLKLVALAHLVWEYGVSVAPASGPSMLPTFEVLGEWLVISKPHRFGRGVSIGDVVAYSIPINDEVGVKRVLGLPGDYVLMDGSGAAGGGGGLERETGAAAAAANMIQVRFVPLLPGGRVRDDVYIV